MYYHHLWFISTWAYTFIYLFFKRLVNTYASITNLLYDMEIIQPCRFENKSCCLGGHFAVTYLKLFIVACKHKNRKCVLVNREKQVNLGVAKDKCNKNELTFSLSVTCGLTMLNSLFSACVNLFIALLPKPVRQQTIFSCMSVI